VAKKVVVTTPLPDACLVELARHADVELLAGRSLGDPGAAAQLAGCHGLVCLLTDAVSRAVVQGMDRLEFVASVSVGVDHIDVPALTERGIPVGNTPGVLVDATADLALALLLAAARRVAEGDRFIRAGQWRADNRWAPDFFLGKDLRGATLGIVGLGAIGRAVAQRAAVFGLRLVGWTPSGREVPGVEAVSLEELLACSDYVSVHVALAAATRNLIGAREIAAMKPGAVLVNTARGGIVDEAALARALDEGRLFAAGLDVFEREPLSPDSPLLSHPRVVLVPHVGSATARTRLQMVELAVANAVAAIQGRPMPHCVNPGVYGQVYRQD